MEKYEFTIDGVDYTADSVDYEYGMLEGEEASRSEDGTMFHQEIGLQNKVCFTFSNAKGLILSNLLKLVSKTNAVVNYFDVKEDTRITKNVYVKIDPVKVHLVNDCFTAEPFQVKFIQNDVD